MPANPEVALAARAPFEIALREIASWPARRWIVFVLVGGGFALAIGIPTDIVPTPLYRRMTPVTWWDYPISAASSILTGLVGATYVRADPAAGERTLLGGVVGGGIASFFAVGCPICNKLVVAALGASGALAYFGPIQPLLGVASIMLLATAFALRLRGLAACRLAPS